MLTIFPFLFCNYLILKIRDYYESGLNIFLKIRMRYN
jgi:hypothetical protein